jgi:predicted transposase YbfD/YdcC
MRILKQTGKSTMAQGFGASPSLKTSGSRSESEPTLVETATVQQQWLEHFADLTDPRGQQGIEHPLLSLVMIAILAVIGGASGWEDIQTYGESHRTWLNTFLSLPAGIPSADTYRRVFKRLDPQALERCFLGWVEQIVEATGAQVIPIDGKTLKGSYDRTSGRKALHVVSAWASEHRLLLGQVKVESKTNEITAIPSLLELLDIQGSIITLDAIGTQVAIARQIQAQGGDYLLALKANHPTLYAQVTTWFEQAHATQFAGIEHGYDQRVEAGHHRRERRQVWVVPVSEMGVLHQIDHWAGGQTIVMVKRFRQLWNQTTVETMFYLSSLPCDIGRIAPAIRTHWGIENQLHWVLDVTFGEDACRIRTGHGPDNFALLRRLAISVLNQETSKKRSLRQKSKRAAMSPDYMLTVLTAALPQ